VKPKASRIATAFNEKASWLSIRLTSRRMTEGMEAKLSVYGCFTPANFSLFTSTIRSSSSSAENTVTVSRSSATASTLFEGTMETSTSGPTHFATLPRTTCRLVDGMADVGVVTDDGIRVSSGDASQLRSTTSEPWTASPGMSATANIVLTPDDVPAQVASVVLAKMYNIQKVYGYITPQLSSDLDSYSFVIVSSDCYYLRNLN